LTDDSDQKLEGKASADYGIDELTGIKVRSMTVIATTTAMRIEILANKVKSPKPAIWS